MSSCTLLETASAPVNPPPAGRAAPTGKGCAAPYVVLGLLLVAAALVRFWHAPIEAGGRLTAPDGVEYAVAAHRLATLGTLDIDVGGMRYPIRYPPLFSAVLLAPVYWVAPGEIGNGIVVVLAFALVMVGAAYAVGWHLAGAWGAAAAALALILHPLTAELARTIMSDLPAAALAVVALALFLRLARPATDGPRTGAWLGAGLAAALATGLRPLSVSLLLPFVALIPLLGRRHALRRLITLLIPTAVLVIANGIYNHDRFGSWARTGYHFWCPLPYDFPHLTWSWLYLWDNARLFLWPPLGWTVAFGLVGLITLVLRRHGSAGRVAAFIGLAALPISLAHLYYFHREPRFHLPLVVLCCVVGAAGLMLWLPQPIRTRPWGAVALAVIGLALARPPVSAYGSSRPSVEYLAAHIPPGATLVTGADPVGLDVLFLRPGARHWVPVSRRQNYAGHPIAPRPIRLPAGAVSWPSTHRAPAVMAAGARDAVLWTALERPDLVLERAAREPGVYYDSVSLPYLGEAYKRMNRLFEMRAVDPQRRIFKILSLRQEDGADKPSDR